MVVLDEAIRAAVTLSHRYIPSRQLPDKAISLLDTACARVALSHHAAPRELQEVRQRLLAADVEAQLLDGQLRMGLSGEAALGVVHARLDVLAAEALAIETRWTAQVDAVQELLASRAVTITQSETNTATFIERLRGLKARLVGAAGRCADGVPGRQ